MLPKQTQLQNNTLIIQMPVSTVSWLAMPPRVSSSASTPASGPTELFRKGAVEGAGIISGFTPSRKRDPVMPTAVDRRKPGMDRSMSHHRRGLASARVADACSVESHANFL
jgi:hypothetical protein